MQINNPNQIRAITWRSVSIGLAGILLIALLAPYNDHTLNNTFLIGNNIPIGVVLVLFAIALLNAVLSRLRPSAMLSTAEVSVSFTMLLVGCAVPSSGLMRYWPASEVMPMYFAASEAEFRDLFEKLHLPHWLFPTFSSASPTDWPADPVVQGFAHRWTGEGGFPYRAWLVPLATWGIFAAALYGALLCMASLLRKQWLVNERLAFPLAQIQLALVEQPAPGRAFNSVLSRRSFWIAFWCVFAIHLWNGLSLHAPRYFVAIPLGFNLTTTMAEPPLKYVSEHFKQATLYFSVMGICFFLSSSVALSLWFFFIAQQIWMMIQGSMTSDASLPGTGEQHFGGLIAYSLVVLWIGRKHWALILKHAFTWSASSGDQQYIGYRAAFWGLVICLGIMVTWLIVAGMSLLAAVVLVAMMMLGFFMITRLIAEVGLVHGQVQVSFLRPWIMSSYYGLGKVISPESFYLTSLLHSVHYDYRETVGVYATHAMKIDDQTIFSDPRASRSLGRKLVALMALSLAVAYVAGAYASIRNEYAHESTVEVIPKTPIDDWGAQDNPHWQVVSPNVDYSRARYNFNYSPAANWAGGFALTALLGFLRVRYSGWPLHPIGYLMIGSFPLNKMWLSFFVGWVCKAMVVRLGGSRLYEDARPLVIGLILGEALAAGFWLIAGLVLSSMGIAFHAVRIMPI